MYIYTNITSKHRLGNMCSHKSYIKPQQNIQSPNRQYKAPTDNTKPRQTMQRHQKTTQSPNILDQDLKYSTRVATNVNLTFYIQHPILKSTCIN